jgi:DegV family protein with EDD domain
LAIKIVTDSTCDLPDEVIKEYDITVVPVYVNLGEESYQDGVDLNRNEFYSRIERHKIYPTTASPAIDHFSKAFSKLASKGADCILSIHLSSSIGGVFNVAQLASKNVKRILVHTFDTGQISIGTGFIVAAAAKMAKAGKNLNEIIASIQDLANRTYTFAMVDNLNFLKHSGRISQFKTLLGSILQVKPVLRFYRGIPSVEVVRTSKAAFDHLIRSIRSLGNLERLSVLHINAHERALILLREAEKQFAGQLSPRIIEVSPAIGTHIGPGAVGFAVIVASPEQ